MIEPTDHTGVVDRFGDTWVRADDMPGRYGPWWPLTDGPSWEPWARSGIGQSRTWAQVEEHFGPLTAAAPERVSAALERVKREVLG